MREEHISFWESIEIPGHLYLFFTNKAAKEDIHKKICKRKTFMALVGNNKAGEIIYLNTDKEELACVLNDEGGGVRLLGSVRSISSKIIA